MEREAWLGYSPRGHKELDMTEQLHSLTHNILQDVHMVRSFWTVL